MKDCEKFVKKAVLQAKNHGIYIWGGQGQLVNQLSLSDIAKMETGVGTYNRVIQLIDVYKKYGWLTKYTRAFDCSGLVSWCLAQIGREEKDFDMCALDLSRRYPRSNKLREGCLVFREGHISIYIGYNRIVEAKGRDFGVVISPYVADDWDGYCDPFEYER